MRRCFGTIKMTMPCRRSLTFHLLALWLLTSCATAPDATPAAAVDPALTPTPFQPGAGSALFTTPFAPPPAVTFTPYPMNPPHDGPFAVPQISTPSAGASFAPVEIDPLTGLPPSDPTLLDRRPLAIKISNYPREIRPQYGLTLADQVFEYYIEWFDTRFIGIFYGNNAKQIGPVRSGRYFDEHITRMFHAYYVFNFADPRVYILSRRRPSEIPRDARLRRMPPIFSISGQQFHRGYSSL